MSDGLLLIQIFQRLFPSSMKDIDVIKAPQNDQDRFHNLLLLGATMEELFSNHFHKDLNLSSRPCSNPENLSGVLLRLMIYASKKDFTSCMARFGALGQGHKHNLMRLLRSSTAQLLEDMQDPQGFVSLC